MKLSFIRYKIKEKERFIIQVHVPESVVKPVILKYKNIPSIAEGIEDNGIPNLAFTPVPDGTVYDAKILSFCYYQAHKVSEIAEYLGVSDSIYFRKQVLENLLKNQYLIKSKASRAIYYKTNPEMV